MHRKLQLIVFFAIAATLLWPIEIATSIYFYKHLVPYGGVEHFGRHLGRTNYSHHFSLAISFSTTARLVRPIKFARWDPKQRTLARKVGQHLSTLLRWLFGWIAEMGKQRVNAALAFGFPANDARCRDLTTRL